ncbi:sulfur carrier protein ThiS [Geomicrobium sp. JCM 19037]|uniref:sulfur carrier protein ThiS n=2 Tax=unclassified Geomicrobium TaxID=2628951 RepID=UPI0027D83DEE|nr:sulfur carrier protein ThiS [Geomicrobium sp. JCM 19037]
MQDSVALPTFQPKYGGSHMEVTINQQKRELPNHVTTIEQLREHFGLQNTVVMIEHNGAALSVDEQNDTHITAGDQIEMVRFVGGG